MTALLGFGLATVLAILGTVPVVGVPEPPPAPPAGQPTVATLGNAFGVRASIYQAQTVPAAPSSAPRPYAYDRMPAGVCEDAVTGASYLCFSWDGAYIQPACPDGSGRLWPLLRRQVGDPVADWLQVDSGGCPGDAGLVEVTAEELRRLLVTPSTPQYQPANGRGLVNMELIVYTDPTPQILSTTVLGIPVTVRATPAEFAWEFGDGSDPLVTTDPGAPYPDFTVAHIYRQPGSYEVQLTTTWRGEYQINGEGPWLPVAGTATTTSPPFAETVVEARSHLVADDLGG